MSGGAKGTADAPTGTGAMPGAERITDAEAGRDLFVELGGHRFHYIDFGGDGPPLVLAHGTGLHAWCWAPVARELTARYRVLALDARGHGDSAPGPGGYDWGAMADDLTAFVATLGLDRPYLVGHSMGGATILLAVARRPDLARRALLIDPIIFRPPIYDIEPTVDIQPMAQKTLKRRDAWKSAEHAIESYAGKLPFSTWRPEFLRLYVERGFAPTGTGGIRLKCPPEIEAETYLGGHRTSPWPLMPGVTIPVRLLVGTKTETGHLLPPAELEKAIPGATLGFIPDATHFLPMEKPDELTAEIEGFDEAR